MNLEQFLLTNKYVTNEALIEANLQKLTDSGKSFGEIIGPGILESPRGSDFLDHFLEFLFTNLEYIRESHGFIDYSLAHDLGSQSMRDKKVFPLGKISYQGKKFLKVLVSDNNNLTLLDFLAKRYSVTPPARAAKIYNDHLLERLIEEAERTKSGEKIDLVVGKDGDEAKTLLIKQAEDDKIKKLTNMIIGEGVLDGASDIHFEIGERNAKARYRIDGDLEKTVAIKVEDYSAIISRIKIMSKLDIAERRMPQDGKINVNTKRGRYNIRVSTMPTEHGESVVLRLLALNNLNEMRLNNLGMPKNMLDSYVNMIKKPYGLILVTGPTGSGKTTTLYASLQEKQNMETKRAIYTIEDPIEYSLIGINQTQVHEKIDLTFAEVLRALLRQDPDTIMVGEIRDKETAELAFRAAQTGHLVLSTLHTNSAIESITRLADIGVPYYMIASSLLGVMSQRLVKKICEKCVELDESLGREETEYFFKFSLSSVAYKGAGCSSCNNTGYKGRIGLYELFPLRPAYASDIDTGEKLSKLYEIRNVVPIRKYGLIKVNEGKTTLSEVLEKTAEY